MNRQFSKPIRTYGKKKFEEVVFPIPKLVNSSFDDADDKTQDSLNKNSNKIEGKEFDDDSMNYDPFDTTFDRLVKTAKIPQPAPKTYNDTASFNSTSDNILFIDNKPETDDLISLPNGSSNFKIKPISKQKTAHKNLKMQSTMKTMVKKNKSALQVNGKFKIQRDNSRSEYKVYKTRNKKKTMSYNLDMDFVNLSSCVNASEGKDHKRVKKKTSIKKEIVKRKKNNSNIQSVQSLNNVEIKPCSVILDKHSTSKWNNKLHIVKDIVSSKEASKCAIKLNALSDQHETIEMSTKSLKYNKRIINHCSVKMERLKIDSFIKPLSSDKTKENMISSTPNSTPIRPSTHLITLSPIALKYIHNTLINEDSKVSLEPTKIIDNLNKESDAIEEHDAMEKVNVVSSCLTDLSNVSKCYLSQSEPVNTKGLQSPYMFTSNASGISVKTEFLAKRESVSNNPQIKVEDTTLEKYITSNIEKTKLHLSFAVDTNRSQSLFDDSNKSVQNLSHEGDVIKNETEVSASNSELHTTYTLSNNDISSDSVELWEKSILNTNRNRMRTSDETQKDMSKVILVRSLTTRRSDASLKDIENKIEAEERNYRNSDTSNINEQTLPNKRHTLNVNDSLANNTDKCSNISPNVVLRRLQDPVRITRKRKYTKWDFNLYNIAEDSNNSAEMETKQTFLERASRSRQTELQRKALMSLENIADNCINNIIEKPVFLKPGKSWTRSLSILNNIPNESDLDKLSVGKGKRWRHSVRDILNMQKQGIIQSCIRRNDSSDKELKVHDETINKSESELANNSRTCDSTNLGRISRRISVRVVPIHKTIKSIEDVSFLEVYGIFPVKSKRFTLLSDLRKSTTCNIQTDDIHRQTIEEPAVSAAREVILQRCLQSDYIQFSTYFTDLYLEYCRKIGEGVYGEVFLYEQGNTKSVIKIIPIEGSEYVNGEPQKKFHEILSEIVIAMELHNLRFNTIYNTDGFVEVKNIKCIQGRYPDKLIEFWNIYDQEKRSDNDCPSMFDDDQLYIVLELGNGGQDLEAFVFNTAEEAHILFVQAALALAVAEKAIQFEHRDLHWGNILISLTNESHIHYKLGQKNIKLISKGVKVSIIDFTLSRVTYQSCSIFNDLASDPTLFTAQGEYQFEIYRLMRDKVKNNWQKFEPYTNILWLHYTLDKMITAVRYRRKNLKIQKHGIAKLTELKNEILGYSSAFDFVTNCDKIVNLLCISS